jgi:hypothetical protein
MGGNQSAPEADYEPDFMSAHVRRAQSELSPTKIPFQGKPTAMGADSWSVTEGRKIQAYTRSTSAVTGSIAAVTAAQGKSSIDAQSFLMARQKQMDTNLPRQRPHENIAQQDLPQPRIPPDSMDIVRAKNQPFKAQKPRNRFDLMSAPDTKASAKLDNVGHFHIDAQETQIIMKAKKETPGAFNRPFQGIKATVDMENYLLKETQGYQKNLSSVVVKQTSLYQGIAAKIPQDAYLLSEYKKNTTAIREANQPPALPFPVLDEENFFAAHLKGAQILANDAHRVHPGIEGTPTPGLRIDFPNEGIMALHAAAAKDQEAMQAAKAAAAAIEAAANEEMSA